MRNLSWGCRGSWIQCVSKIPPALSEITRGNAESEQCAADQSAEGIDRSWNSPNVRDDPKRCPVLLKRRAFRSGGRASAELENNIVHKYETKETRTKDIFYTPRKA